MSSENDKNIYQILFSLLWLSIDNIWTHVVSQFWLMSNSPTINSYTTIDKNSSNFIWSPDIQVWLMDYALHTTASHHEVKTYLPFFSYFCSNSPWKNICNLCFGQYCRLCNSSKFMKTASNSPLRSQKYSCTPNRGDYNPSLNYLHSII